MCHPYIESATALSDTHHSPQNSDVIMWEWNCYNSVDLRLDTKFVTCTGLVR